MALPAVYAAVTMARLLPAINGILEVAYNEGKLGKINMGKLAATFDQLANAPVTTGAGGTTPPPSSGTPSDNSFKNYFYPGSDIASLGFGTLGRAIGAYHKGRAAKEMARGNAPQHLAASMGNPSSDATFGNPLANLAQISADAGQAKATGTLAAGEAWQGSLQDISNFISSINTMRRLMSGNALSAMSLLGMGRIINPPGGRH
jgi:hypothetical protein